MDTLLIINPASGQGKADRAKRRLLDLTARDMPHVRAALTSTPDHAFRLAQEGVAKGCRLILVAGGDGTINQVINGIGDSGIPLGIVPLGTGNVLAHDLCIPTNDVDEALRIIEGGRVRLVDLAVANGRRFVLMAGFGFDAEVIDSVSPKVKDVLGTVAYAPALLKQISQFQPVRFQLTFPDQAVYEATAFAVVVANCGSYAYNFKIAPEAVFDDGLLDVLVIEGVTGPAAPFQLISKALESVFQQRIPDLNTTYFRTTAVQVKSSPPVKVQIDGDVVGESGTNIRILPKALKLIVP